MYNQQSLTNLYEEFFLFKYDALVSGWRDAVGADLVQLVADFSDDFLCGRG